MRRAIRRSSSFTRNRPLAGCLRACWKERETWALDGPGLLPFYTLPARQAREQYNASPCPASMPMRQRGRFAILELIRPRETFTRRTMAPRVSRRINAACSYPYRCRWWSLRQAWWSDPVSVGLAKRGSWLREQRVRNHNNWRDRQLSHNAGTPAIAYAPISLRCLTTPPAPQLPSGTS